MHRSPRLIRQAAAVALIAASSIAVPGGVASAEPAPGLPDADLFCGPGYADQVESFVARPPAASLWIDGPTYGGHYAILDEIHYEVPGLVYQPVLDPSTLPLLLPLKSYGQKAGLDTIRCEVVSRFAASDFTVISPLTLVAVPN
jgi:hypothetical protein